MLVRRHLPSGAVFQRYVVRKHLHHLLDGSHRFIMSVELVLLSTIPGQDGFECPLVQLRNGILAVTDNSPVYVYTQQVIRSPPCHW